MPPSESYALSRRRILKLTGGTAASIGVVRSAASNDDERGHGHNGGENCRSEDHRQDGSDDSDGCDYETVDHHMPGEHGSGEHSDPANEYLLCPDHPHTDTVAGHTMHHVNAAMGGCPTGTGLANCDVDTEDPDLERINEVWPDCTPWPEPTKDLIKASRETLMQIYNEPGTLIARGYIPYFDVLLPGATGGVSHWLNPGYIGDNTTSRTPSEPDAVILDNQWWKPLGPMYIATDEGDVRWHDEENEIMEVRDTWGYENDCGECFPYHPHDGVAGRFAWWYYRQVHEQDAADGDVMLPCYTAPVMHSWIYPTPDGPHSATSGAPPRKYRPDGPPNQPGYPSPVDPAEEELSLEVLPEAVQETAMPRRLAEELAVIDELSRETLMATPISELEALMAERLGPVADSLDAVGPLRRPRPLPRQGRLRGERIRTPIQAARLIRSHSPTGNMVRFCPAAECRRYEHPLPQDAGQCPDCGSTELRLDPAVSTHTCAECGVPNAGTHGDCWACGADLDEQSRSIDLR